MTPEEDYGKKLKCRVKFQLIILAVKKRKKLLLLFHTHTSNYSVWERPTSVREYQDKLPCPLPWAHDSSYRTSVNRLEVAILTDTVLYEECENQSNDTMYIRHVSVDNSWVFITHCNGDKDGKTSTYVQ